MIYQDDTLLALLPANRKNDTVYSHSGLTYGGLVVKDSLKFDLYVMIFKHLLQFLESQNIKALHLKELPQFYCKSPSEELQYLMHRLEAIIDRKLMFSCLDPVNARLSKDRKAGVKRGIKSNLNVREEVNFEMFWNEILIPNLTLKHQAQPVHSLHEITALKASFPTKIRQFNVYKNETLVAGTTVFETNLVAHSQYISGNKDKNTLGSLDFLHEHLLTSVFKDKNYFDFGTSHEDNGAKVNKGLLYWKEGFGARSFVQNHYKVKTNSYHHLNNLFV